MKKLKSKRENDNNLSNDEIIIGVTVYPDKNKKNEKAKVKAHNKQKIKFLKSKSKNKNSIKSKKAEPKNKKDISKAKHTKTGIDDNKNKKNKKSNRHISKIIKWTSLFIIIIAGLIYAMMSPLFNINKVSVNGNNSIPAEKIIDLSNINIGENIFKINKKEIINNIKKNGYIDSIKVERKLPDEVELTVKERTATFMIAYGNSCVYINNQGYILEISDEKKALPTITGINTPGDDLTEANRLNDEDLTKLNMILKIMSVATVDDIESLISNIDISDENNYKIDFATEQKTAYLGDCSDLETRMLYMTSILKNEKGKAGEIFVNMNLNTDNAFFREKV